MQWGPSHGTNTQTHPHIQQCELCELCVHTLQTLQTLHTLLTLSHCHTITLSQTVPGHSLPRPAYSQGGYSKYWLIGWKNAIYLYICIFTFVHNPSLNKNWKFVYLYIQCESSISLISKIGITSLMIINITQKHYKNCGHSFKH